MSKVPDNPVPFSVATAGHDDTSLCYAHTDPTNIVGNAPLCQNTATHRVEVADPVTGGVNGGEFAPAITLTQVCGDHLAVIEAAGCLIAATPLDVPRAELVRGLRELADWYEQHPEVPIPSFPDFSYPVRGDGGPTDVKTVASALDAEVETSPGGVVRAKKQFGPVEFRVFHIPAAVTREYDQRNSYASVVQTYAAGSAQ